MLKKDSYTPIVIPDKLGEDDELIGANVAEEVLWDEEGLLFIEPINAMLKGFKKPQLLFAAYPAKLIGRCNSLVEKSE